MKNTNYKNWKMRIINYKNYKIIPFGYNFIVQMPQPDGTKWLNTPFANAETCKKYIDLHIYEVENRKQAQT
jgi:hypothetical protein